MKNLPLKKSTLKKQIGLLRRQVMTLPAEGLIQSGYLKSEGTLPLVIRPVEDLISIQRQLLRN